MCKQDFPKTRRLNLIPRVICPGVARTYKVNVKGRRNSLCLLLARRRCAWLSGCSPTFAVWTGANTHIAPNFRIPLTERTHDPDCERQCLAKVSVRRLTLVTQKAMRQATGYFSGYICKRQPVGRFQLRQAARSLPLFKTKVLSQRTAAGQMAQVVSKMFCTLETRGKLRTAAEECNLAANACDEDKMSAEFICLFATSVLPGYDLINRLEHEKSGDTKSDHIFVSSKKAVPKSGEPQIFWYNFADVYGFRPPLPALLYLSPWEFVAHWTVLPLHAPLDKEYALTRWIPLMTRETASELIARGEEVVPGTHYEVNESTSMPGELAAECCDAAQYAVYGSDDRIPHLQRFRSLWILRRRDRPVVPVLRGPMPHRGVKSREQRARLLSLYLRPWVMQHAQATIYVPHIRNLDEVRLLASSEPAYPQPIKRCRVRARTPPSDLPWATRSYDRAWRSYIRGNVVSECSARLIQTFLTIMAGTGKLEHDGDG